MTTRETVERYFAALQAGAGWEDHFADDVVFTSHGTPAKRVSGREAFLESTRGFYGMIRGARVRDLLVDGGRACALVSYQLEAPGGRTLTSEVAELFTVADGRIGAFAIYFDSAPYAARA